MYERQNALHEWLSAILGSTAFTLNPITGDASFRRYFRLTTDAYSRIVMDAPPDKETIAPFINIGQLLSQTGVHTPHLFAHDVALGFVLLEDMGDELLLKHATKQHMQALYHCALDTLLQIQTCPAHTLPNFDGARLLQEMNLFPEWFLKQYLQLSLTTSEGQIIDDAFQWLIAQIEQQPRVFVHRDYHSRNLMVIANQNPCALGVIDFQDAVNGPFTYDLVSLLKDCYIQFKPEQLREWIKYFYERLPNHCGWSLNEFTSGFELCGLQRHLKVLGIFCRLHLRDHKPQYLNDLPLTFQYTLAALENIKALQPFYHFMLQRVYEPFLKVSGA